jgi:hypothetical protein
LTSRSDVEQGHPPFREPSPQGLAPVSRFRPRRLLAVLCPSLLFSLSSLLPSALPLERRSLSRSSLLLSWPSLPLCLLASVPRFRSLPDAARPLPPLPSPSLPSLPVSSVPLCPSLCLVPPVHPPPLSLSPSLSLSAYLSPCGGSLGLRGGMLRPSLSRLPPSLSQASRTSSPSASSERQGLVDARSSSSHGAMVDPGRDWELEVVAASGG